MLETVLHFLQLIQAEVGDDCTVTIGMDITRHQLKIKMVLSDKSITEHIAWHTIFRSKLEDRDLIELIASGIRERLIGEK